MNGSVESEKEIRVSTEIPRSFGMRSVRYSCAIRAARGSEIPLKFRSGESSIQDGQQDRFPGCFQGSKMGAKAAPLKSLDTSPLAGLILFTNVNMLIRQGLSEQVFTNVNTLILNAMPQQAKTSIRTEFVGARLTPKERELLAARALEHGLSVSMYVQKTLSQTLKEPSPSAVTLAYLELLTEDVARLETIVTYVVANLRAGNKLTATDLQQLTSVAASQKKGYASARLKAARANAASAENHPHA